MAIILPAVLVSAFCLFLIQPLLAKQLLPAFGGSAGVWAVCLLFYQAALLGGYLYAHALIRFVKKPRTQALVHLALVSLSLLALPIGLDADARPGLDGAAPGWAIVRTLALSIGVPYFVLSTTSPLLQAWQARLEPRRQAYRLFGWSNLSCALALLVFPFGLEPWVSLDRLNGAWGWGYALCCALLGGAALRVVRRNPAGLAETEMDAPAPGWLPQLQWVAYAMLGSVFLSAVTNHLCQSVAPMPFLWTVPLLLYLLTFFVVFEREWYARRWAMPAAGISVTAMAAAIVYLAPGRMLAVGVPVFTLGCFFTCLYCHGEMARLKPPAAHLTRFYLLMALGGALGSLLVAFGAPLAFHSYAELPVALSALGLLILFTVYRRWWVSDVAAALCAVLATAPAFAYVIETGGTLEAGRNFYGALRVESEPATARRAALLKMVHGAISHGSQFLDPALRRTPTTYYGPRSAPGVFFAATAAPRRVGVVGLGTGTLACYGQRGDRIVFYELNPLVETLARRHFSFLADSRAAVEVRLGDGRLQLEAEPPQGYDLLVVDAFSGDSIPLHLLTREALGVYRRHLKPGGVLAFHLSNLHLGLQPAVRVLAEAEGLRSVPVVDLGSERDATNPASWALVGSAEALRRLGVDPSRGVPVPAVAKAWTDAHSSLLPALEM